MGEAGVVAIFAEAILAGKTPKIRGEGEQTRDYVFVGDVVETAARALASGKSGTWNVGTGVETSVNRLFELLARALDYTGAPEHVPPVPGEQRRSVLDGSRGAAGLRASRLDAFRQGDRADRRGVPRRAVRHLGLPSRKRKGRGKRRNQGRVFATALHAALWIASASAAEIFSPSSPRR